MSEYIAEIEERFDPVEYMSPDPDSLVTELPDDPDISEVIQTRHELKNRQESGGAILTGKILAELRHLSAEVREEIGIIEESHLVEWNQGQKDDVHLFFTFVGQVQEYLLREAVITHVISSEAATDEIKKKIKGIGNERAMPVHECIEYLEKAGAIDNGLKGEIRQVRGERNETVHDMTRWFFADFDPQKLEAQVSRGERSVVRLIEVVYGFDLE